MTCAAWQGPGVGFTAALRLPDGCVLCRYMSLAVCEFDKPDLGPLVAAACSDGAVR